MTRHWGNEVRTCLILTKLRIDLVARCAIIIYVLYYALWRILEYLLTRESRNQI